MDSSFQELQMDVCHKVKAALNDFLEQIQNAFNLNCNNHKKYNENEGVSPIETTPLANNRNIHVINRFKQRKLDAVKIPIVESVPYEKGGPKESFLFENNLNFNSLQHEWFDAFLPKFVTSKWTSYTNIKALIENAGTEGGLYPDYKKFTPDELRKHLGIYILQGLSISPQVDMKFNSQAEDDINGIDFISRCMGPGATRQHKHFWRFFTVQDPRLQVPPRSEKPNWKIDPFLGCVKTVSVKVWNLPWTFSVDKQAQRMQGRHPDKLRITYKKEGDGFQCDALCDNGYTYTFFFRHDSPPIKYKSKELSPLHARVMELFDSVEHQHHRCGVDNLYISAKFCKDAYNHPKKVMMFGVTQKSGCGLPSYVIQEELQKKRKVKGQRYCESCRVDWGS